MRRSSGVEFRVADCMGVDQSPEKVDYFITRISCVSILKVCVLGLILLTICGGCETTGSSSGLYGKSYNIFYSRADHLNELLVAGEIDKASEVWNQQSEYFKSSEKPVDKKMSLTLSDRLTKILDLKIKTQAAMIDTLVWPTSQENWPGVKEIIDSSNKLIQEIEFHQDLEYTGAKKEALSEILPARNDLVQRVTSDAPELFKVYRYGEKNNFFVDYPVKLDAGKFLDDNRPLWISLLNSAPPIQIRTFGDCYRESLGEKGLHEVGNLYCQALLAERKSELLSFPRIMDAVKFTKDAGFPLKPMNEMGVRIVQMTSQTLLREGQIEFPVGIDIDLPFAAEKTDFDTAFDSQAFKTADIIVLVDVISARQDRKIKSYDKVSSQFQSGITSEPNPDYDLARIQVSQAQINHATVQRQASYNAATCKGWGCIAIAAANVAALAISNGRVNEAMEKLSSTPTTISKPVYAPYQFNKAMIDAAKVATVNYYIIDRLNKYSIRSTVDIRENKSFVVAYGLHAEDIDKSTYLSSTDSEDKVVEFEKAPVTIPLSKILAQFNTVQSRPLASLTKLRNEVLADKNAALAAVKSRTYTATPAQDKRFESVVVVYHPQGSMGAGFFVKDDLVLTNYHVIKDSKFVEMRLHNGSETFGKVVAQDVRLDLALIKAQARGIPIKLYSDTALPLGHNVEVIGHPKRLQFSITRGIVSGIREIDSSYTPGGRKVKFIQTDAAMNEGNSGGPVFLNEKVVGVSTQKLAAVNVEGLNFAVHYGEVLQFLEANQVKPEN